MVVERSIRKFQPQKVPRSFRKASLLEDSAIKVMSQKNAEGALPSSANARSKGTFEILYQKTDNALGLLSGAHAQSYPLQQSCITT
jgi:hypothetical protein